jgi:outer membrane protein assembly factor BamB
MKCIKSLACQVVLACCFTVSTSIDLQAADWPQWRGPQRDGISGDTGLLKQWPTAGPALVWNAPGLGRGFSSVSVVGNRIYTLGESGDTTFIRCLDAASGKVLWSSPLGKSGGGGGFPGPRGTPSVDNGQVYALGQYGDLVCVKAADGSKVWQCNLMSDHGGKIMSGWGNAESVLVDGPLVVCTPGGPQGTLLALNKDTGAPVWRTKDWTSPAGYASVIVGTVAGVRQYIASAGNGLGGVSPKDGRMLWQAPHGGKTAVIPTPIVAGDSVYAAMGYGVGATLVRISAEGDTLKATTVYQQNKNMANQHGGVVRVGDHVYGHCDGKGWICQNVQTGDVAWRSDKLGKGSISSADGMLYLRSEGGNGTIVLLEASPAGWNEKGRFDPPLPGTKEHWAHMVIANGRLYVRDQDQICCFDVVQK